MYRHKSFSLTVLVATAFIVLLVPLMASAQTTVISHLTYGSHAREWHEWLEWMAQRFEADTGIRVEVEVGPSGGGYRDQLVLRTSTGIISDVMDANPGIAAPLIQAGMFTDLRPFVEASGVDLSQFPPVALEGMTAPDGTMWGFALSILPIPVYYNTDMFRQAGLLTPNELGDDWTWEQYLNSARALTLRDADGVPYQSGTIDQRFRWEQVVHQAGGTVYDRLTLPTESYFNSNEVLAGIEFRMQMYNEGLIATTGGVWNGNVALTMIDPPTIINKYVGGFEMDVAMQPKGPGGRGGVVNADGLQIHQNSPNKQAAWQWVNYLLHDMDGLVKLMEMTGRLPAYRDALFLYGDISREELPRNWPVLMEAAFSPDAYPTYMIPSQNIIDVVNKGMGDIWNARVAPAIGLQQIHEQVTAIFRELN